MNVLSLFDGISCGQLALSKTGHKVSNYYSSEIDQHAMNVTRENFPNTTFIGDVVNVTTESLPVIDLLLAGSPCQGFSSNGGQLGFEHKQSKLFWHFIRLLRAINPTYFLLENVSMKKEWRDIISREVGVEPICINSQLVSAQSRKRYYWTNIPGIEQPADRGLTIFDILELPAAANQQMLTRAKKAYCLTATHGNCLGKDGLPIPSEIIHNTKRHQRTCILDPTGDWRMLTPVECERLQTVPDGYTACVSQRQRYRALGNGWTVDVIAHILSKIK